jgi:hypothetical protein
MLFNIKNLLVFCSLLLLQSCITSLHRLVTYDKAVLENNISGTWQGKEKIIEIRPTKQSELAKEFKQSWNEKDKKQLSEQDKKDSILYYEKSYVFSFIKSDVTYFMLANFIRLNNELYADIYPLEMVNTDASDKKEIKEYDGESGYTSAHTFAKVIFSGNNSLELKFLSGKFISGQIGKGRVSIKNEKDELSGAILITASTEELQRFIVKYGRDERLYDKNNTVILTRKT